MKLHHTAALALVGWYLMVPPAEHVNLPISRWNHIASFDTADKCETDRVNLEKDNRGNPAKQKLILLSECIASDDPRLAK
jgi:hypothetical protein